MTPAEPAHVDRERAYHILSSALDQPESQRDAFVSDRCRDDAALLAEVRALLAAAAPDSGATQRIFSGLDAVAPDLTGQQYGRFRLVERIGVGGSGAVYRAERTDGVPQSVAVKVLRARLQAADRTTFLGEAKLLARLEHPGVAHLIDVDVRDGEGWIAIELVRGRRIDEYCDHFNLGLRERIRLLIEVTEAVAAAHRLLVVHRDIKPSNVLVTDDGRPKLIDFGIASALEATAAGVNSQTAPISAFTPHYGAPEQIRGEPVSVATDVFGLGALAYRLLSGRVPFSQATSVMGYLLAVTTEYPVPPSVVARDDSRHGLARALRGDLDAIVLTAMQRAAGDRYPGATELADDLRQYLQCRPIRARPASIGYRLGKFLRRRTVPIVVACVGLLAGSTAIAVYVAQVHRAAVATASAARRDHFLEQMIRSARPEEGHRDITVAEILDSAAASADEQLGKEPLVEASLLGLVAETDDALGRYPQGLKVSDRQLEMLDSGKAATTEIAHALLERAGLLRAFGRFEEARPVITRAIALLGSSPESRNDLAASYSELGIVEANTGHEREAESADRQAIALAGSAPHPLYESQANALSNLAVLQANQGRYPESAEAASKALQIETTHLATNRPLLLTTEQIYAVSLNNLHRSSEALPLMRDIIARSADINGPSHSNTIIAQIQLGEVLFDLGRYAESESVLRPAAEASEKSQGPETRNSVAAWTDYARAACGNAEHAADGLVVARRVAEIRDRTLPPTDWRRRFSNPTTVAWCLVHLGRFAEAEPMLVSAVSGLEAEKGSGFWTTQFAYHSLRELYRATGRDTQADVIDKKILH